MIAALNTDQQSTQYQHVIPLNPVANLYKSNS